MVDGGGGASDLLVIFGITGDLARKMTFRALYRLERHQLLDCPILGVASDDMSVGQLVKWARESIGRTEKIDDAVFDRLAGRLSYLHGDVTDSQLYDSLAELIGSACRPLYYLEMPPALFAPIVENLANVRLLERARVAVEKPFGHDLASALELNARLRAVLGEDQILRVDHFLGKQPVVELEYLRFANQALAELWDRNSISEIHITMAEDFGVEDRGKFYDAVGALRDVVQNHLLQVLALVTMEPPVGSSADDLNDKKAEVFRAMAPLDPDRCVRGQYLGYTEVAGVKRFGDRNVCRAANRDRQLALGRGADLRAGRKRAAREGHRSTAISTPSSGIGLSAQPPTGRAQPDCAAYRPRSGYATADFGPHRRLVARYPPGLLVRGGPR